MLQILGELPVLNELVPGKVSLGAPVERGAIQIGKADCSPEIIRLDVHIEQQVITVAREDGEALQIVSYFDVPPAAPPESARRVLAEPLGRMTLRRHLLYKNRWGIDEVWITDSNRLDLTDFAGLIGEHALEKQNKS